MTLAVVGGTLQANGVVKFTASGAFAGEELGRKVGLAIDGDTVVVGASHPSNPGRAFILQQNAGGANAWGEVTQLTPSSFGQFGNYVAISGDYAIVGARLASQVETHGGAAFIFERDAGGADAWHEVAALTRTPSPVRGGFFGQTVAIEGARAFVGETGPLPNLGRVYVYERDATGSWNLAATIQNPDASPDGDSFGISLDVEGDRLAVGASNDESNTGAVFIFERDGAGAWNLVQKLTGSLSAAGSFFAHVGPVALSGDVLAVGAQGESAAYVFERDPTGAWHETRRLTPSGVAAGSAYGFSVALDGDLLVVGARTDDEAAPGAGALYLYGRDQGGPGTWGELAKVSPGDVSAGDVFSESVALRGTVLLASSPGDDDAADAAGAVYIFNTLDLVDPDADGDAVPDSLDNCPALANPGQEDNDADGLGDACDADDDADGVDDASDNCPFTANADQSDLDGDLVGDVCDGDGDGDGFPNEADSCPLAPNPDQLDTDGDGSGDACDVDDDDDTILDQADNCPVDANVNQADLDMDGLGDVCDADVDGDGVANPADNCPLAANPGQDDTDNDLLGDVCDPDVDGDTIANEGDNCPFVANADQADLDGDSIGDVCDGDGDGDGIDDVSDNCPQHPNADQADFDGDFVGDTCDGDVDGDGVANAVDQCGLTALGAVVAASGCSLEQLAPCAGPMGTSTPWRNHGQYVSAVAKAAKRFAEEGLIDDDERGAIMSAAAASSCGQR